MTWEEHEAEYCKDIKPRPDDIWEMETTYAAAHKTMDNYQMYEENHSSQCVVRWEGKYYVVFCNSSEDDEYYQRI